MFQDAILKVRWAAHNIKQFQDAVTSYTGYGVRMALVEANPRQPFHRFMVITEPLPFNSALIAGDIVRNLRAALDHAVSAIYRAKQLSDGDAYFPIGDTRKDLCGTIKGRLEKNGFIALTPFFLDEIEATETGNCSPIWILNQIDRANKHRSHIVVEEMVFTPMPDSHDLTRDIHISFNVNVLKPAQCNWWDIPEGGDVQQHTNTKASLRVTFGPTEVMNGRDVIPSLENFTQVVFQTIEKLSVAYAKAYP